MSVTDGQDVSATVTNAAFVSKTATSLQTMAAPLRTTDTTQSTSKDTGSIITEGGIGAEKNIHSGGSITAVDDIVAGDDISAGGDIAAVGTVTGSNVSGTNTGNVTLSTPDSSPNGNGLTITGQVLQAAYAGSGFPGILSAIAQSISGLKTFLAGIVVDTELAVTYSEHETVPGTVVDLDYTDPVKYYSGGGDDMVFGGIIAPSNGQFLWIVNGSSGTFTLDHENGTASAERRITCPGSADVSFGPGGSVMLWYDQDSARWRVLSVVAAGVSGPTESTQTSLSGGGTITLGASAHQYIRIGAASAITLAADPFATTPTIVTEVTLIGTSDSNTVTIAATADLLLNGDVTLGLNQSVTVVRLPSFGNWVEKARNF